MLGSLSELGLSDAQKLRFSYAVQNSTPEQLTAEEVEARYRSWFGDQYEANLARLERVWEALSPTARLALSPRRGSPDLVDEVLRMEAGR